MMRISMKNGALQRYVELLSATRFPARHVLAVHYVLVTALSMQLMEN